MSSSSEQKKKSTLVHRPFLTGQINIFNPPKANPNGRLAAAKLFTKDRKTKPHNFLVEQLNKQIENRLNLWSLDNTATESSHFPLKKTTITAIAIIMVANILSAIVIFNQKQKTSTSAEVSIEQPTSSQVGNMDLSAKEFIELKADNLSSIPQAPHSRPDSAPQPLETKPIKPLAIPPLNMTPGSPPYAPQITSQYYYILSEYTGDDSLALAQEKVPNVSLISLQEGVFIYMGAFEQKELAQQFLAQLKQEGLYAYIYPAD